MLYNITYTMNIAEYFTINNVHTNRPKTKLGQEVANKLPFDYLFTEENRVSVDVVDSYVEKYTKDGILLAIQEAVTRHGVSLHCDPYELFIDSKTIKL